MYKPDWTIWELDGVLELAQRTRQEVKPFDVIVKSRNGSKVGALGVYALNDMHALEIARQALGIRGPMVAIKDYKAGTVETLTPNGSIKYIDDILPQLV